MLRRSRQSNSILAVDFGSITTRVVLIDLVDGQYRLLTRTQVRTTLQPPADDVRIGLGWALANIEATIRRPLLGENDLIIPEENGQGIDEVVATSSAGRPLNAVLLGLMPDISISSARRALTGTYINVAATLSIAEPLDEEARINRILQARPDLIFISGGMDGGNEAAVLELVHLADLAAKLVPDDKPIILYAGNGEIAHLVEQQLIDSDAQVHIAKNVRPALLQEDLAVARLKLAQVYSDYVKRQPGGFGEVADWTQIGIVPTAQSVTNIIRWLGDDTKTSILHLDIGSATSTLAMSLRGEVRANIHSDLGMGHSFLSAIERLNRQQLLNWLPFELSEEELLDYAYNKILAPDTIPQTQRDLFIEYALARQIARHILHEAREGLNKASLGNLADLSSVITAGAVLTETAHPGIAAMLALDVLELEGDVALYADADNVMAALGAIAYTNPTAAVQVFDNQGINYLGVAFCPPGTARRGRRPAMRIQITLDSGRVIQKDLMPGELWTAPLPPGQNVSVDIRLGRGLRINNKRRIKQQVLTGTAGIIFDVRGRPLPFVPMKRRLETYTTWWKGVTNGHVASPTETVEAAQGTAEAKSENTRVRQNEIKSLQAFIQKAYRRAERDGGEEGTGRRRRRGKQPKASGKVAKGDKGSQPDVFEAESDAEDVSDWEELLRS